MIKCSNQGLAAVAHPLSLPDMALKRWYLQLQQAFEATLVERLQRSCGKALQLRPNSEKGQISADEHTNVLASALQPLIHSGRSLEEIKAAVFQDPEVLGTALDIVGAYLKNYEAGPLLTLCCD
eukprot:s785_g5.t1